MLRNYTLLKITHIIIYEQFYSFHKIFNLTLLKLECASFKTRQTKGVNPQFRAGQEVQVRGKDNCTSIPPLFLTAVFSLVCLFIYSLCTFLRHNERATGSFSFSVELKVTDDKLTRADTKAPLKINSLIRFQIGSSGWFNSFTWPLQCIQNTQFQNKKMYL